MTDAEARALGERWLAAGGGWRRGMSSTNGLLCRNAGPGFVQWDEYIVAPQVPDLRDPATRGACLEVVRECREFPTASLVYRPGFTHIGWAVIASMDPGYELGTGATEAEALVAALEAVPRD